MPHRLLMQRLDRITLVQKSGPKLAKHPSLRTGVVEVVKATPTPRMPTTVKKADFIAAARSFLFGEETGVIVEDDEPAGTDPTASGAPGEPVEKAANPPHDHSHAHLSAFGYSYSHSHEHAHRDGVTPKSENHDSSETAHAHVHISKAGESVSPEFDGLMADIKGLSEKLGQLTAQHEAESQKVADLEAQVVEVTKARDAAVAERDAAVEKAAEAEAAKTEAVEKATQAAAQLTDASRQPLTAGPVAKAATQITPTMKFDDAFDVAMGRDSSLPR